MDSSTDTANASYCMPCSAPKVFLFLSTDEIGIKQTEQAARLLHIYYYYYLLELLVYIQ